MTLKKDSEIIAELFRDILDTAAPKSDSGGVTEAPAPPFSEPTYAHAQPAIPRAGASAKSAKSVKDIINANYRRQLFDIFEKSGCCQMPDSVVLEMLFFYIYPEGIDTDLALALVNSFGSLTAVMNADFDTLCGFPGITRDVARFICFMREVSLRYTREQRRNAVCVEELDTLLSYCHSLFVGAHEETLMCIYFDNEMRIVASEAIANGTDSTLNVSVRTITESAMRNGSTRVALTHNHIRGSELPSRNDRTATLAVLKTLATLGIELLDHIVVSETKCTSMRGGGYLEF